MTEALVLKQISKRYNASHTNVHALRDVNLTVKRGELVAIMGPSGSGKSTLLTIAGTLEQPTSGTVEIGGIDVQALSNDDRARLRCQSVGYVFQDFNLLAGLTALENAGLPLELAGLSTRDAQRAGMIALDLLGIAERAAHFPHELSGGERQRVAIARAIVGSRYLVLADEPTGALDSIAGETVMRLLRKACQEGVAGVIVTHDAQLAAWADRVIFLRDGRMVDQTLPSSTSTRTPLEATL